MESIVNDALVKHVFRDNNNLVSNRQWGYRPEHSTEYLMIHLTETWRTVLDFGKFAALAYIDFRKAFDRVPPRYINNEARNTFWNQGINPRLVEELFDRKKTVHSVKWR